jgi:hypothetical protein
MDEVENELTVSLGAGHGRVYDAARLRPVFEQRIRHLTDDAPAHNCIANNTSRRLASPRFELRLDENESLPP